MTIYFSFKWPSHLSAILYQTHSRIKEERVSFDGERVGPIPCRQRLADVPNMYWPPSRAIVALTGWFSKPRLIGSLKYFLHRHLGSTLSGPAQRYSPAGSPHLGRAHVLARCSRTARSAPEHGLERRIAARARTGFAPQDGAREEPPGMERVERPGKGGWKKLRD